MCHNRLKRKCIFAPCNSERCKKCTFILTRMQILHYTITGGANMGELKELRIEKELTQQEAADLVGVSLRSYKSYENEEEK